MAAGGTLVASKQSIILPFFPVKLKTTQKTEGVFRPFLTDGIRLFALSGRRRKIFWPPIHCSVNQK